MYWQIRQKRLINASVFFFSTFYRITVFLVNCMHMMFVNCNVSSILIKQNILKYIVLFNNNSVLLYLPSDQESIWAMSQVNWEFGGQRSGKIQTNLLSLRGWLESWNFGYSKYRYYRILVANNKGADQTALMRRLTYAFVFSYGKRHIFSWPGSYCHMMLGKCSFTATLTFMNEY